MRLFVRGCDLGTTSLEVLPNQTVSAVKNQIENILNIAASAQRLAYAGTYLQEDTRLDDYDIEDCACLELNCDLLGGAKKRKKKVYSTPKKIKHKRKKVKLATLKFYKVRNAFNISHPVD
ncbi:small subunit ribosomal protein S27Ae [Paragonimus westermani]|uniref:Small subunit ribosomal protein S27Ae n=1 Tax=Paragonimus westermani TaxID=34504 RepID=A0A5J4NIJ1_9TREM|nr:small subunit ribosomal protein S27Ae [Paragonimus westermani]